MRTCNNYDSHIKNMLDDLFKNRKSKNYILLWIICIIIFLILLFLYLYNR